MRSKIIKRTTTYLLGRSPNWYDNLPVTVTQIETRKCHPLYEKYPEMLDDLADNYEVRIDNEPADLGRDKGEWIFKTKREAFARARELLKKWGD